MSPHGCAQYPGEFIDPDKPHGRFILDGADMGDADPLFRGDPTTPERMLGDGIIKGVGRRRFQSCIIGGRILVLSISSAVKASGSVIPFTL